MKNSVTTNYRRNSDNSSEQIQRIVIWTEIMIQSIMNLIFCEIFEQRIVFTVFDKKTQNKQKVKLKRAQGECLVTGSRRRT
jgi:hypothetical protein